MKDYELRLMQSFPRSFINGAGEFIALDKENEYFCLANCQNEFEVKCKVLEWFSRGAFKTQHYKSNKRNEVYHKFMLDGINQFLNTTFNSNDMELIYGKLGNNVNRELCEKFIKSGYDISVLKVGEPHA